MAFPVVFGVRISTSLVAWILGVAGIWDYISKWWGMDSASGHNEKIERGIDNVTRSLLNINNILTMSLYPNKITDPREFSLTSGVILPLYSAGNDEENNFRNLFLLLYKAITGSNMTPDNDNPDIWLDSAKIMQFPISGISPFFDSLLPKIDNLNVSVELLKDSMYFLDENDVAVSIAELFSIKEFSLGEVDLTSLIDVFKININETEYNITEVLKNILTISENPDFSDNIASGFLAVGSRAVDEVAKAF